MKNYKLPPSNFGAVLIKNRPSLKESSIKTYANVLKNLEISINDIEQYEKVRSIIIAKYKTTNSIMNAYTVIIVFIKYYLGVQDSDTLRLYEEEFNILKNTNQSKSALQEKSNKECDNWIGWEELVSKREEFRLNDSNEAQQKFLILSLYTKMAPLRNDWVSVKINNYRETDNYLDIENSMLVLNNYKTDKVYGEKLLQIPIELMQDITMFLDNRKIKSDYLLCNLRTGEPIKRNTLTIILSRMFYPKKVSTSMIRKIYLSHKYPVTHTLHDLEEDANVMCHDWTTGYTKYRKK
jgi:hypothetical protein